jgi:transposase
MIPPETVAEIRRLFYVEHWKIGTIAEQLGLHHRTVQSALATDRFNRARVVRASQLLDPYLPLIGQTLQQYPRLQATRIYQMIAGRGYTGSLSQLRRILARLRPATQEPFLSLRTFPGEQGQADWAHFGEVAIGQAKRKLSCFVLTLSWSRALYLQFFFDQTLESFLQGHVAAFHDWGGCPRSILYDNLASVVVTRRGDAIQFHPRILELAAHYHFAPKPCRPARGNEKGRVERAIQYIRHSFFAARPFSTLTDFNAQARKWRDSVAHTRPWPGGDSRTVADAFQEEKPRLLTLPAHPLETDQILPVRSVKTIYVRFDRNDYSIPPDKVGHTLTVVASPTLVRILDGATEIARHRQCWSRHELIEHPGHREALLAQKRKAVGASPNARLLAAAPDTEALLDLACSRGYSVARLARQLLHLLDDYGPSELRAAVTEALSRQSPHASSIAYILQKRHRDRRRPAPLPVSLDRRPDLADLHVQPHQADLYDHLRESEPED